MNSVYLGSLPGTACVGVSILPDAVWGDHFAVSQLAQFIEERNPQPDFAKDLKLNHASLKRALDGRGGEVNDREETTTERG